MAAPMMLKVAYSTAKHQKTLLTKTVPVLWTSAHEKSLKSSRTKLPKAGVNKVKWVKIDKTQEILHKKKQKEKKYLGDVPQEDVWLHAHYPLQRYSLQTCITRHRELAQPAMLNNLDGLVYFEASLDLHSTKKEQRSKKFNSIQVLVPNEFKTSEKKRIAVISLEKKDQEIAEEMGAEIFGGLDIGRMIETGGISVDDFDVLLSTPEAAKQIIKLRPILLQKFPNKRDNTLDANIQSLITFHLQSVEGKLIMDEEFAGRIQVPLGPLEMETDKLIANYNSFMPQILKKKAKKVAKFVTEMVVVAPPSDEKFYVDMDNDDLLKPVVKEAKT
ncbi:hypothetical protein LOTGIDRAFT_229272 [Lottia gigantea]|uniref:39S ribosomal protein L1, mitochondrial n=1 Tax=Lottia gigantea TaxID=225164 RepID=V4BE66_LOTGI|nr:hypothetical protein LOTGIDRAFT_229272 [Lottia gigantea]ESO87114.1 hypothetical protein LOTGIDRAFT_229272 [Lottia gigantea]